MAAQAEAAAKAAKEQAAKEAEAAAKAQAEAAVKEREMKAEADAKAAAAAEAEAALEPGAYRPPAVPEGMPTLDEVVLESEVGIDYSPLREMLKKGEFRNADDWTRATLIDIAGEKAQERGWVYFAEVPRLPYKDVKSLDDLWRSGSGGKFGYSRQREIYARNGKDLMKMYEAMDWVTKGQDKPCPGCDMLCPTCVTFNYRSWKNDEFIYDIEAADGHLPLTSTLRGTKLLANLLNHPAVLDNAKGARR
uniref:GUN4-like domain-containing protein n=1 Tax=Lotharella oceanica TaxID=641309 RepID=A0A7S2XER2_9EUKA